MTKEIHETLKIVRTGRLLRIGTPTLSLRRPARVLAEGEEGIEMGEDEGDLNELLPPRPVILGEHGAISGG
jgi:hypothetical protein